MDQQSHLCELSVRLRRARGRVTNLARKIDFQKSFPLNREALLFIEHLNEQLSAAKAEELALHREVNDLRPFFTAPINNIVGRRKSPLTRPKPPDGARVVPHINSRAIADTHVGQKHVIDKSQRLAALERAKDYEHTRRIAEEAAWEKRKLERSLEEDRLRQDRLKYASRRGLSAEAREMQRNKAILRANLLAQKRELRQEALRKRHEEAIQRGARAVHKRLLARKQNLIEAKNRKLQKKAIRDKIKSEIRNDRMLFRKKLNHQSKMVQIYRWLLCVTYFQSNGVDNIDIARFFAINISKFYKKMHRSRLYSEIIPAHLKELVSEAFQSFRASEDGPVDFEMISAFITVPGEELIAEVWGS